MGRHSFCFRGGYILVLHTPAFYSAFPDSKCRERLKQAETYVRNRSYKKKCSQATGVDLNYFFMLLKYVPI